jgi:hypothetical protein
MLILQSIDRTDRGVPVSGSLIHVLSPDVEPSVLGEKILLVCASPAKTMPHDLPMDVALRPLFEAAGVSSWTAFMRGARDLSISVEEDLIWFLPSTNLGQGGGFAGDLDHWRSADARDPADVGRVALESLAESD